MRSVKIRGYQKIVGESQGYLPLPIRWGEIENNGEVLPIMQTQWVPDDEERKIIAEGGSIILTILGKTPPPVMLHASTEPYGDGYVPELTIMQRLEELKMHIVDHGFEDAHIEAGFTQLIDILIAKEKGRV